MEIKKINKYVSEDGKEFNTEIEAVKHQYFIRKLYDLCKLIGIDAKQHYIDGIMKYEYDFCNNMENRIIEKKILNSILEQKNDIITFLKGFNAGDIKEFRKKLNEL